MMQNLELPSVFRNRSRSSSNASTANLSLSSQHNPQPALDFTRHVEEVRKKHIGRNGNDKSMSYVPDGELRTYWTDVRVRELSQAYTPHLTIKYEVVNQRCLRLFSLLVYTNRVQFFDALRSKVSDEQLPLSEDDLPLKAPIYKDVFDDMCQHQWIFCPLVLDYARLTDLELDANHILPFYSVEEITQGDAAHILKVNVDKSCSQLHSKDKRGQPPHDEVYVLKSYHGERYRRLFLNDSKALTTLHQKSGNEHIVGYYGSYIQNGKFNLLLQFANTGSLLDYYNDPSTHPPKEPDEIRKFWRSLLSILIGLHQVHQIKPKKDESGEYRGIHEDIKPDNILLNRASTSQSPYDFTPLLTDFGHSHFRVPKEEGEDMGVDRHGNQTYGAPEVSKHARYLLNLPSQIPTAADIWSIGCVISDAAAWVVLGPDGREEYRKLRVEVGKNVENFEDSGHHDCFHDAVDRSQAVDQMHTRIRDACHPEDTVTPKLLDLVQNHMLLWDWKQRLTASAVYERSRKIISESETKKRIKDFAATVQTNIDRVARGISDLNLSRNKSEVDESHESNGTTPDPNSTNIVPGPEDDDDGMTKAPSVLSSRPKIIKRPWVRKDKEKETRALNEATTSGGGGTNTPIIAEPKDESRQPHTPSNLSASPILPPRPGSGLHNHSDTILTTLDRMSGEFSPSGESHVPGLLSPTSEEGSFLSPNTEPDLGGAFFSTPPSPGLNPTQPVRDVNDLVKLDLSMEQAMKWRDDWKNYKQQHPDRHRLIRDLQHTLKGRDHIFFIDDSRTMKQHASAVETSFETLAYIVKPKDGKDSSGAVSLALGTSSSDGTNRRQLYTNSSHTTKLVEILKDKCTYSRIETVIEDVLSDFIDQEILPRLPPENRHRESLSAESPSGRSSGHILQRSASASRKRASSQSSSTFNPISLIIFTDGRWGIGEAGAGVDNVIKRLTGELKKRELKRTQVMIQFLRVGDDEAGIRHLNYLAALGRDPSDEYKGYSIVDTQSIKGNLCSILIGSISSNHIISTTLKSQAGPDKSDDAPTSGP